MAQCKSDNSCPTSDLLAKKLNNQGAAYIEAGCYGCAIPLLLKGLKHTERSATQPSCPCRYCSLEYCVTVSQTPYRNTRDDEATVPRRCASINNAASTILAVPTNTITEERTTRRRLSSKMSLSSCTVISEDEGERPGFICRRTIRVSPQSMQEGHPMGASLSLIIIFNLALAYHLSALQKTKSIIAGAGATINGNSIRLRRDLSKAMQLYELAYQLQLEDDHQQGSQMNCLRFTMMVSNNLGQIHLSVKNHAKHAICMQHLLSTMMYLVDCQVPVDSVELDGFFRNTSKLILQDKCAGAA